MPQDGGCLVVRPHDNKSLDTVTLKGYLVREHRYDVRMDAETFQLLRDGFQVASGRDGGCVAITPQGQVRRAPPEAGPEPGK